MSAHVLDRGHWTSPKLDGGDAEVAVWAGETLAAHGFGGDALCLATLDSGASQSIRFWRDARETGLAFANPRGFPWTLANSPAGRIAQELGIRGPTYTLVGRTPALAGAFEHALELVSAGTVSHALVVALDQGRGARTRVAALCLGDTDAGADAGRPGVLEGGTGNVPADASGETASEALARAIDRLDAGEDAHLGSDRDGWFRLTPGRA
jgi:hypothetical protein